MKKREVPFKKTNKTSFELTTLDNYREFNIKEIASSISVAVETNNVIRKALGI